jgi:hypothetical protein
LKAPSTVTLKGDVGVGDGNFGVVYTEQFVYDGDVNTNGSAVSTTPFTEHVTPL